MNPAAFGTILTAVDLSELSAHALRHAATMASCGNANIVAVYASWLETPPYFTSAQISQLKNSLGDTIRQAETSLSAFVHSTLGDFGAVTTRVAEGMPADTILRLAFETKADLIVTGTHGRTGYNRWMLGSVAERVLRESPVPVLTVRSAPPERIAQLLCPVEDTEASRRAFNMAARLGACFGATVTALHVEDSAHPISNLCSWIPSEAREQCKIRELTKKGEAAAQIVGLATEGSYDLLVVGAPQRRFFGGQVLGATTLRAVRHSPCPVMTVGEQS